MASAPSNPAEPYAHLIDPDFYEVNGYPHATWRELRAERPVHCVKPAG